MCCFLAFCTVWRRARLWLELFASTVGWFLSQLLVVIFMLLHVPSETPLLYFEKAIGLSREILMFLAAIWSSLCSWCSMYRFIPPLIFLVPQDSYLTHYAQFCWLCCVFYTPLFGLIVQARSCFRSSMWISSVAGISKFSVRLKLARKAKTTSLKL